MPDLSGSPVQGKKRGRKKKVTQDDEDPQMPSPSPSPIIMIRELNVGRPTRSSTARAAPPTSPPLQGEKRVKIEATPTLAKRRGKKKETRGRPPKARDPGLDTGDSGHQPPPKKSLTTPQAHIPIPHKPPPPHFKKSASHKMDSNGGNLKNQNSYQQTNQTTGSRLVASSAGSGASNTHKQHSQKNFDEIFLERQTSTNNLRQKNDRRAKTGLRSKISTTPASSENGVAILARAVNQLHRPNKKKGDEPKERESPFAWVLVKFGNESARWVPESSDYGALQKIFSSHPVVPIHNPHFHGTGTTASALNKKMPSEAYDLNRFVSFQQEKSQQFVPITKVEVKDLPSFRQLPSDSDHEEGEEEEIKKKHQQEDNMSDTASSSSEDTSDEAYARQHLQYLRPYEILMFESMIDDKKVRASINLEKNLSTLHQKRD